MKKPFTNLTVLLLALMSFLHLLRILVQLPITIGEVIVPLWASVIGCLVPAFLAFMLRAESRTGK